MKTTQNLAKVSSLDAARKAREKAKIAHQTEARAEALNPSARAVDSRGDELRYLWVSQAEVALLSHMHEYGLEAAARRLMELAGKPWPKASRSRKADLS